MSHRSNEYHFLKPSVVWTAVPLKRQTKCYIKPLEYRYLHMEVNAGPSQRMVEMRSESSKEVH